MSDRNLNGEIMSGCMLKLLRHSQFTNNLKTPISAQLIITNRCNLRCIFCVNQKKIDKNYRSIEMSKEVAKDTIKTLKELGVKGIEFTGGGEPLLHPYFEEIMEYAIDLKITTALVTNGVRLTKISKDLLGKLDWIRVSINSGREDYKKIHGVDQYDQVLSGLAMLDALDISNKGVSCIFNSSSTVKDIQSLLSDLQKFSLDYFRLSTDILDANFKLDAGVFKSDKIPIISHSERPKYVPKTCGIFYYKPVIDCNGVVYPCCTNLYRELLPVGRVENLKTIIEDKNISIDTSKCAYCIYGSVNDMIDKMDDNIKNVDFI